MEETSEKKPWMVYRFNLKCQMKDGSCDCCGYFWDQLILKMGIFTKYREKITCNAYVNDYPPNFCEKDVVAGENKCAEHLLKEAPLI